MKKAKLNVRKIKFNIYAKIIFLEIIVLCIMRFLVPVLLNYPPMSEDKIFQSQIEPLSHTAQYLLLGAIGIIAYILCLSIFCSNIFKYLNYMIKIKLKFLRNYRKSTKRLLFNSSENCNCTSCTYYISAFYVVFYDGRKHTNLF